MPIALVGNVVVIIAGVPQLLPDAASSLLETNRKELELAEVNRAAAAAPPAPGTLTRSARARPHPRLKERA